MSRYEKGIGTFSYLEGEILLGDLLAQDKHCSWKIEALLAWCEQKQVTILFPPYPNLLSEMMAPPRILFVMGNPQVLLLPSVAVVGSRNASWEGRAAAMEFAAQLCQEGYCVVSGLAKGIDAAAHRGALQVRGNTVAVLGHGLDRVFPSQNLPLAHEILESGGCLVSEYFPETPPLPYHFPARNRIISGLSLGTLVIEARERSGSLITAQQALENNRELFVLPGKFGDLRYRGSHQLLQQGAKLVLCVEDIVEEFGVAGQKSDVPSKVATDSIHTLETLYADGLLALKTSLDTLEDSLQVGRVVELIPQKFFSGSWEVGNS